MKPAGAPRILYVSALVGTETFRALFSGARVTPSLAAQKYHRLMTKGLVHSGALVTALSAPPATRETCGRRFLVLKGEKQDGVRLRYLPIVGLPAVKHAVVCAGAFFYALFFLSKDAFVVCDGLNVAAAGGARAAAKLRGRPCAAIVTDVPNILADGETRVSCWNTRMLAKFDGYVLLTEAMNPLVNPNGRPYLVAEGQVDAETVPRGTVPETETAEKICLYAGMLHEKYGVLRLAEAFSRVKDENARLVFYGDGDAAERLRLLAAKDPRIECRGVADNETVVREELRAALLINPRPSGEQFTAYSFPSKNLEYMASGTPVLTTRLSGMPREYDDYAYLFDDESVEGMARSLEAALAVPGAERRRFGAAARAFVLEHKSNVAQARRVLAFLRSLEQARRGVKRTEESE